MFVSADHAGFEVCDLRLCINWMHPFAIVFSQKGAVSQKTFSGVSVCVCVCVCVCV